MQSASPSTSPTCLVERQRRLVALARALVIGAFKRDVAEALDAIGLAEHVAAQSVERQRRLVALARALVVGALKGDVAEALNAIGLAERAPTFW